MPKGDRNIVRIVFSTAIFIAMEVAALHFLSEAGGLQRVWIARISHGVERYIWGKTESVKYYFSLDEQNRILTEENVRLRELAGLRTDERAEAELDAALAALPPSGFTFLSARIVKMSENKQHNYLLIDRGEEDGVSEGDGIITSRGVVGIVEAVGDHYAYAISFKNKDLSVSARIGREGAAGPMSWDGRHARIALLRDIPLQSRFEPGDTVYTSGHSAFFPADIPLGVTASSTIVNGATYEVKVELFQDFSTLKYVSVVRNEGEKEIRRLEQQATATGRRQKP